MQPTITISVLGLGLVFSVGFVAGWLLGRVRLQGSFKISFQKPDATSGSSPLLPVSKTVQTLNLKCQCGATWRFHETSGHPDQGSQPMPTGDTFTCPSCGRSIDLHELHKSVPEVK